MSHRVTIARLEAVVARINKLLDCPADPYSKQEDGTYKANVGNYHLSFAYGGVSLHQMCSEGGGVRDVLRIGHVSKRELESGLHAFIAGIETAEMVRTST
jgi:hypothetical protein